MLDLGVDWLVMVLYCYDFVKLCNCYFLVTLNLKFGVIVLNSCICAFVVVLWNCCCKYGNFRFCWYRYMIKWLFN